MKVYEVWTNHDDVEHITAESRDHAVSIYAAKMTFEQDGSDIFIVDGDRLYRYYKELPQRI